MMKYACSFLINDLWTICSCSTSSHFWSSQSSRDESFSPQPATGAPSHEALAFVDSLGLQAEQGFQCELLQADNTPDAEDCEVMVVLPLSGVSNGFIISLLLDHQARQYRVLRFGGVAGVHESYGPIKCDETVTCHPSTPPLTGESRSLDEWRWAMERQKMASG